MYSSKYITILNIQTFFAKIYRIKRALYEGDFVSYQILVRRAQILVRKVGL